MQHALRLGASTMSAMPATWGAKEAQCFLHAMRRAPKWSPAGTSLPNTAPPGQAFQICRDFMGPSTTLKQ